MIIDLNHTFYQHLYYKVDWEGAANKQSFKRLHYSGPHFSLVSLHWSPSHF